jgi:hypothetical protein
MRTRRAAAALIVFGVVTPVTAHRLDEYLQATTISLEKHRVQAQLRLTPGVAVFARVMAIIDTDHDGMISTGEQRAYAERVLEDLSVAVDGDRLRLRINSVKFPGTAEMKEGRGEIQIGFAADVPHVRHERKLVFENHHQRPIATYLVNCLVPRDADIRIASQKRNYEQSLYELHYVQGRIRSTRLQ